MNISPVPSYKNQTSFGMAFKKPSPEVLKMFNETLTYMRPDGRKEFVNEVAIRVQRAKSCPVNIEHVICNDGRSYGARVGNNVYTYNPQSSTNRAISILEVMDTAIGSAENQHDINVNAKKLNDLFA